MSSLEILENASDQEPFWLGQKDDDLRHVFKAIDQGDLGVLRWLTGFGAARMAEPNSGLTTLMYAVARSRPDMVCPLIPHAELEQADEYGMTALLVASCNGNAVCLKALIPVADLRAAQSLFGGGRPTEMRGFLLPDVGMAFGAVQVVLAESVCAISRAIGEAFGIKLIPRLVFPSGTPLCVAS